MLKKYGYVFILDYFKRERIFVISFVISLIFLFIISNICFKLNVIHSNKSVRKFVSDKLYDYGVSKFKFIPNYDKRNRIISNLIKKNKDKIEWLEIERIGNTLNVKVNERKINKIKYNENSCDIVAKKDGIIKKIVSSSGEIKKEIDDYVKKGDVIISGAIKKDDEVKKFVSAKGKVYAEVWYKVNVGYPLYYEEVKYYNKVKNKVVIVVFDKEFKFYKNYDDNYIYKNIKIIKSDIFPFYVSVRNLRKIKKIKLKLNEDEALKKASSLASKKIYNKLKKDEYIISKKTLNFYTNSSKIYVDVFLKVYEDITKYRVIDEESYILDDKKE